MRYLHETTKADRSDVASGWVLRSRPGQPAFPVRLGSEMFHVARSLGEWQRPVHVWDPLCGSANLITTVALLNRRHLASVLASDIDPAAVQLAAENLDLVRPGGLERRALAARPDVAAAARRLGSELERQGGALPAAALTVDALDIVQVRSLVSTTPIDVVLTDIPYGRHTHWTSSTNPGEPAPLRRFVRTLAGVLPDGAVIAVASPKIRRLDGLPPPRRHMRVGRRSVLLWRTGAEPPPCDAPPAVHPPRTTT